MLSRTLSLATVTLLIGCLASGVARALENLEAGKSPSQIFSGTCSACHKSPRGLLKGVSASSLPGYLRQHYTTGSQMASMLAAFLLSNGAADPRYQAKDQPRQKDAKPDQLDRAGRRQQPAPTQEASQPEPDGSRPPQAQGGRAGRDAKRLARPGATPEAGKPADGQTPVQAATDSKQGAKQKLAKPGADEPAKAEEASRGDASKNDPSKDAAKSESDKSEPGKSEAAKPETDKSGPDKSEADKAETAKTDAAASGTGDKSEAIKPAGEGVEPRGEAAKLPGEAAKPAGEDKSEPAKVDAPKESAGSEPTPPRSDSVSPVTPAPPSAAATSGTPEPAASPSAAAPAAAPPALPVAPPAVTATAPTLPPVAPAGPPTPPISR
jgi:hypothetical protein